MIQNNYVVVTSPSCKKIAAVLSSVISAMYWHVSVINILKCIICDCHL